MARCRAARPAIQRPGREPDAPHRPGDGRRGAFSTSHLGRRRALASRALLLDCESMTDDETAQFLRSFLDDYEKFARFLQAGYRRTLTADDRKARALSERQMADALTKRTLVATSILRAAGVEPPDLNLVGAGSASVVSLVHTAFVKAIGACEHGLVGLALSKAPMSPPALEPSQPPTQVPAPRPGYRERIENNLVWWAAGFLLSGFVAGFGVGWFLRDALDAAARRAAMTSAVSPPSPAASPQADPKPQAARLAAPTPKPVGAAASPAVNSTQNSPGSFQIHAGNQSPVTVNAPTGVQGPAAQSESRAKAAALASRLSRVLEDPTAVVADLSKSEDIVADPSVLGARRAVHEVVGSDFEVSLLPEGVRDPVHRLLTAYRPFQEAARAFDAKVFEAVEGRFAGTPQSTLSTPFHRACAAYFKMVALGRSQKEAEVIFQRSALADPAGEHRVTALLLLGQPELMRSAEHLQVLAGRLHASLAASIVEAVVEQARAP